MKLPRLWWLPVGRVPEVSPEELHRWLEEGRAVQLVDARSGLEYRQGTIGDAVHAPVTEMPGVMEDLALDPGKVVVMLCLSGHRSRPGTRWLRARGVEAYSLKGGVAAWKLKGYPIR